jgi:PEP-CTERM motif
MNWKPIAAATAALMLGAAWAQAAGANVTSISDDFTSNPGDTPVLNWTGDGIFDPVPASPSPGSPSVDLVSNVTYPGLGFGLLNAVDLDGSEGGGIVPAGEIQSVNGLAAGNYVVQFWLAGNLRGAPVQTMTLAVGSKTFTYTLPASQGFEKFDVPVSGVTSGSLVSFTDSGPSTQQGNLVADVSISAVPEPASWALMLFGVGAIGAGLRFSRKPATALAA